MAAKFLNITFRCIRSTPAPESISPLLSDAQVEHYAAIFIALNEQYLLSTQHHFIFEDFLENPEQFEIDIHRYFTNKALFENRRGNGKIHLHSFLRYPELMMATVAVEEAYRETEAVKCESLLAAVRKIELAEMVWLQELMLRTFEHRHRVLMRGGVLVEPNTHYYRCERKKAG